jgi:hypothetical protein
MSREAWTGALIAVLVAAVIGGYAIRHRLNK